MLLQQFDFEYKDESIMILLDISMFFLPLESIVSIWNDCLIVFAGRFTAGGSLGSVPAPGGGGHQPQYRGVQLQKLLQEEESCSWWDSLGSVHLQWPLRWEESCS